MAEDLDLLGHVRGLLDRFGYECAPFLVGWYNSAVSDHRFSLQYTPATFAISVISAPRMYELAFLPFLEKHRQSLRVAKDPLDQCTQHHMDQVKAYFKEKNITVDVIYDFDVYPSGQPRVLVQTAGHVAGQAHYYQRSDLRADTISPQKTIYGSSAHPQYGGWFAFRSIFIFKDVERADLSQVPPPDVLPSEELRREFLVRFNTNWQDWTFRDVPPNIVERYSDAQKLYFRTKPRERHKLFGLPDPWEESDDSSEEEND